MAGGVGLPTGAGFGETTGSDGPDRATLSVFRMANATCPHCGATHPAKLRRCPSTGLPLSGDPGLVGTTFAGRYRVVRMLGDGGMGAVYKAADSVLRRFVAIKLLHPAVAQNPSSVERFQREARTAAAIGHPNIIDILDFGYAGNTPFLVMEYVRGHSLAHTIGTEGPLAIRRACSIAAHTLAGLHAAHAGGILHRDLKPANLMLVAHLGDPDFVKICDFGFAALITPKRHLTDHEGALTPAHTLVGTPAYAAPERLRGDDRPDPRTDVYAVGVVLFEMLAGRRPFDAPTIAELARKVRKEPAPSLRSIRRDIPPTLDRVVARALAKSRKDRWDDAKAFAEALVPFGGRMIPTHEAEPTSDTFTMTLMEIKARDAQRGKSRSSRPPSGDDPGEVELTEQEDQVQRALDKAEGNGNGAPQQDEYTVPTNPRRAAAQRAERMPASPRMPRDAPASIEIAPTAAVDAALAESTALQQERADQQTRAGRSRPEARGLADPTPRMTPEQALAMRESERGAQLDASSPALAATAMDLRGSAHRLPPVPGEAAPDARREPRGADPEHGYEGSVVVSVLRFVARRFGERALKDVLDSLPADVRPVFVDGIAPGAWVPYDAVSRLIESVDAGLGDDDLHLVVECGRAAAEGAIDLVRSIEPPQGPTPEKLLTELPRFSPRVIRGMEFVLKQVGKGYGRIELIEPGPPSLTACVTTLGFLDRSLQQCGGVDVEVNLLSCRALGDEQSLFDISWLP